MADSGAHVSLMHIYMVDGVELLRHPSLQGLAASYVPLRLSAQRIACVSKCGSQAAGAVSGWRDARQAMRPRSPERPFGRVGVLVAVE